MGRDRSASAVFAAAFAAAAIVCAAGPAWSGPCTAQIAAFETQMGQTPASPAAGPTFSQTLGAQLHNQPTPRDVEHAQNVAKDLVQAALAKAKAADEAGKADECNAQLARARHLYGID